MLSRLRAAAPTVAASRRTYSFFSSKPPGALAKPQQQQQQQQQSQSQQTNTNVVKRTSAPSAPAPTATSVAQNSKISVPVTVEPKTMPAPTPAPALHPSPVLATMHLHSFFSLDRPMLLLSQPVERLFETGLPMRDTPLDYQQGETEADADAARMLSHSLVMSRVKSTVDWRDALARLGSIELEETDGLDAFMDSVKRKRRKKITKHKYKKRRKLQRSERRRLGK